MSDRPKLPTGGIWERLGGSAATATPDTVAAPVAVPEPRPRVERKQGSIFGNAPPSDEARSRYASNDMVPWPPRLPTDTEAVATVIKAGLHMADLHRNWAWSAVMYQLAKLLEAKL